MGTVAFQAVVVNFSSVDASLTAGVEWPRGSKNTATAAMVVNSQVNQGRMAA
jgi:hypothetical protein